LVQSGRCAAWSRDETPRARRVTILLAGAEAERQIMPEHLRIGDSDKYDREQIAKLLIDAVGAGESEGHLLARLKHRAAKLVRRHRHVIIQMAAYLVSNETLTTANVRLIWRRMESNSHAQ
jgi:hypothetical protein